MPPLLTIFILMCTPLVPAGVVYKLLSASPSEGRTEGEVVLPAWLGNARVTFGFIGSAAFYLLLLLLASGYHAWLTQTALTSAWKVRLPLSIRKLDGEELSDSVDRVRSINVAIQPPLRTSRGKELVFWVVANKEDRDAKFPYVTLGHPRMNKAAEVDLSDTSFFDHNYEERRITVKGNRDIPLVLNVNEDKIFSYGESGQ